MRRTAHRLLIAGMILLLVQAVPPAGADGETDSADEASYLLRYKFKKGDLLTFEVDHESTMTTSRPELTETAKNEVYTKKTHRVVAVEDSGNGLLELAITQVKMSAQFNDEEPHVFDSEDSKKGPRPYEAIRSIVGKPLVQVRVSPRGELLETKPLLSNSAGANAGGSLSEEAAQNLLIKFPEEPIQVGEEWNELYKVKVGVSRFLTQNVTMQRTYRLSEVKDGLATIKLHTALITPINDGMILAQLIQMTPKGTVVFDLDNGHLVSRTLTVDKREVGVVGGTGSMHAKSQREERWIAPKPATAE